MTSLDRTNGPLRDAPFWRDFAQLIAASLVPLDPRQSISMGPPHSKWQFDRSWPSGTGNKKLSLRLIKIDVSLV